MKWIYNWITLLLVDVSNVLIDNDVEISAVTFKLKKEMTQAEHSNVDYLIPNVEYLIPNVEYRFTTCKDKNEMCRCF